MSELAELLTTVIARRRVGAALPKDVRIERTRERQKSFAEAQMQRPRIIAPDPICHWCHAVGGPDFPVIMCSYRGRREFSCRDCDYAIRRQDR